jgi:hypothetical protein
MTGAGEALQPPGQPVDIVIGDDITPVVTMLLPHELQPVETDEQPLL